MTKQKFKIGTLPLFLTGAFALFFLSSCAPPRGVYHTVERGQNLYRISRVYSVDQDTLARVNRLRDRSTIHVGQRLFIPGVNRVLPVPKASSPSAASRTRQSKSPVKTINSPGKTTSSPKNEKPAVSPPSSLAFAKYKGKFFWPLRGDVVKTFGQNGSSVSKGLEIAAPPGSLVRAAAAGKVTYSGNGIKGYGNLIILKHDESFFTVYGFNQKNLVSTGEYVGKEQQIALSGFPPGGDGGCLHFEIRRGKEALDPLCFLP